VQIKGGVIVIGFAPYDIGHFHDIDAFAVFQHYFLIFGFAVHIVEEIFKLLIERFALHEFNRFVDGSKQLVDIDRFHDVIHGRKPECFHSIFLVGSDKYDRKSDVVELTQEIEAGAVGQIDIEQHQFRIELPYGFESGSYSVGSAAHFGVFAVRF